MLDLLLKSALLVALLAASLFLPAGTVAWPMAWALLAVYSAFVVLALGMVDRQLLEERARPSAGFDWGDAALASVGFLFLYPCAMAVAGLDAVRFGWSPELPLWLKVAGLCVFAAAYGIALWAMLANPFFSTFVRVQTERKHQVVSTGPYAWVRHPGYAGTLLAHAAMPLVLGSLWAYAPVAAGALLFMVRARREERTLSKQLPGYDDYRRRVRWRLAPGVW